MLYVKQGGTGSGTSVDDAAGSVSDVLIKAKETSGFAGIPLDFTVVICGELQGNQEIASVTASDVSSIKLSGLEGSQGILNANDSGTVLTIDAAVPVTIENLVVKGGNNESGNGGGIAVSAGSVFLGDGVSVAGNKAKLGGGVYVASGASLFMYGTAIVGDTGTEGSYSNQAVSSGGGIYSEGNLYLGYTGISGTSPVVATGGNAFTGGVCHNKAGSASNSSAYGGGISISGSLFVSGGKISYNYVCAGFGLKKSLGAGIYASGNSELTGALLLAGNKSDYEGGGIYIENGRTVSLKNDADGNAPKFTSNKATNHGGAIFNNGSLEISGKVYIPYAESGDAKNDVFLASEKNIKITGEVSLPDGAPGTAKNVTISPVSWSRGKQVLSASSDSLLAENISRFVMADSEFKIKQRGTTAVGIIDAPIYVAGNGKTVCTGTPSNTGARGTKSTPYATLAYAFSQIGDSSYDYTIYIDGSIVNTAATLGSTAAASSVTIEGANSDKTKDIIYGGNGSDNSYGTASVITISKNIPVTFKKISIRNGSAENGGGLNVSAGIITLSNVTVAKNKATGNGGGIYMDTGSKLILSNGAVIGDSGKSTVATSVDNANSASNSGGGIYINAGTAILESGSFVSYNYAGSGNGGGGGGIWSEGGNINVKAGSSITWNGGAGRGGGISCSGSVTMEGGNIDNNSIAYWGGGVMIHGATFRMSGGSISSNKSTGGSSSGGGGAGVWIDEGQFTMSGTSVLDRNISGNNGGGIHVEYSTSVADIQGGTISRNEALYGGGIYSKGQVTLENGVSISRNKADADGGGIYNAVTSGSLIMNGGTITLNTANSEAKAGGGVYNLNDFTMKGGEISGNSSIYGGGVYTMKKTFDMQGGRIKENTCGSKGSGVYVDNSGIFKMSDSACVETSNDVYLISGLYITVNGSLGADSPVATITPENWTGTPTVLSGSAVSANYRKFALSREEYRLESDGKVYEGYIIEDAADLAEIINSISSGVTNATIIVSGGTVDFSQLNNALVAKKTDNPDTKIKLDLSSVTITDNKVPENAFKDCSNIESVLLPSTVTAIEKNAFNNCTGLNSITLPENLTTIGGFAFASCSRLTNMTVPDSVTSIGYNIFKESGIETLTLGTGVTVLPYGMCYNCSKLKTITINGTLSDCDAAVFSGCVSGETIYYNGGTKEQFKEIPKPDWRGTGSRALPDSATVICTNGSDTVENMDKD